MQYHAMAEMAASEQLLARIRMCYVTEVTPLDMRLRPGPEQWVDARRDAVIGPGWDAAWESAKAADIPDLPTNPGVITDGMILAEVQLHLGKLDAMTVRAARARAWESAERPEIMHLDAAAEFWVVDSAS